MRKFIFVLLFLFITSPCFAATQLLKTVMPSGGDYTSLEACMNANEQNLVTADKYFDVEIDGTWSSADTTAVTIHNYTTDATRYINIYTTVTARHNGKEQAVSGLSSYRINVSGLVATGIDIDAGDPYITVDGLEILNIDNGYYGIRLYAVLGCVIKNNIIHDGSRWAGIYVDYSVNNAQIYNNIVYNFNHAQAAGIRTARTPGFIYNNTVYNIIGVDAGGGFYSTNNVGTFTNNISMGCTDWESNPGKDFNLGTPTVFTTNLSSDATGNIVNKITANQFVNINAGSEDLHLKVGADAIDVGTDLSVTFTTDIDGETRSGTWDIGADEIVSAARRRIWIQ